MELKIDKDTLANLLSKVYPIVPSKSTMPILSNVLLEAQENRLHITATDLETSVTAIGAATVSKAGALAVNGKKLHDIVRELPAATLEVKVDNLVATFKYDKGHFTMAGIEKDEYPKLLTVSGEQKINISHAILQKAVDRVLFAASAGDINTVLGGGLLDLRQNEVRLCATDGHRMAVYKNKLSTGKIRSLLVSAKVWKELAQFSSGIDVGIEENKISFSSEDVVVVSRLMEGEFPAYESVIPKDNDKLLTVPKEEFMASLRRVLVFTPDISRLVKLALHDNALSIEASSEVGEATEKAACKYKGPDLEIGYNCDYFLSILSRIEADEVNILLKDSLSAAVITPSEQGENEELTYLLMPIRLE